MPRVLAIDNLRGIAFIFMLIQHIYVFRFIKNDNYKSNKLIDLSGSIARNLFILLAGISLSLVDNEKKEKINNTKKKMGRIAEISMHALIITLITYFYFPDKFVRFGILHFIALTSFIMYWITPYLKNNSSIFLLLLLFLITPPEINPVIDTITGAKVHYNMLDWFPLHNWFSLLLLGYLIGKYKLYTIFDKINILNKENILTKIGQNCLNLYTLHFTILTIINGKI